MHRGNHEDTSVSTAYGFKSEVQHKYSGHADRIFEAFGSFCQSLPMGGILPRTYNGGAFIVHGGVGENTDPESIQKSPPCALKTPEADILWSDPDLDVGGFRLNESRGDTGSYFGLDVVDSTLSALNVEHFVRSHEVVYNGCNCNVTVTGKKLWTVFSVTDYPNYEGCNEAGFMTFQKDGCEEDVRITRFESEEFEGVVKGFVTSDDIVSTSLIKEVFLHKSVIHDGLVAASTDGGKSVTREEWGAVMRHKTGMKGVDWEELLNIEEEEAVIIDDFLEGFEERVTDKLEKRWEVMKLLHLLFVSIDVDKSGTLDRDEFVKGVEALNNNLPNDRKISGEGLSLFDTLDLDGDGKVDLHEFAALEKFLS